VLRKKNKIYFTKFGLVALTGLLLTSCAHQSKVKPSQGHIDGEATTQNNSQNTAVVAPIPKLVRSAPQLPPPKATSKAQTYSVVVNEVPVKEILFALARESKLNIDIHPSIQGRATLNAVDQTLPAILERLAKQVDLTYKMDGNVLYIAPDSPVLRNYKIDYVNMNRDTKSFIGADGQISSSSQIGDSTSTSGNGANNSSRTSVDSTSKNHLWESLIQNLKDLLAETDKEVIVSRIGTAGQSDKQSNQTANANGTTITINTQSEAAKAEAEDRDRQKSEYKTLLAANVIANAETGVISVRATNKQHEKVQEFIDRVMGSAKKQVLIEATIVEVRLNDSYQAGIDWSRLNNPNSSSGFVFGQKLGSKGFNFNPSTGAVTQGDTNALGAASTAGLFAGYLNPVSAIGNIAASVTLLKQFGDTKVLSSPKLMVLNNQTAVLKVVDNLVYFTVQAQQSQAAVGGGVLSTITTTPNTVPVGMVMSVTPQINDTGNVNINVRPTISRVLSFVRDPNPQLLAIPSQIPQIQVREMESILQVSSGSTAVLGGLMQDEIVRNSDKVPGLSDVPGVGKVFTGKNNASQKTELVIFLRPTVIPNASLESDELQSYKQYLPAQQLQNVLEEAN
jgi:MSHA biogenesis protein MshL